MLDVRAIDFAIVADILVRHAPPDAAIVFFGSRVDGRAARGSDLDVAVDAGRPLTTCELATLETAFVESSLPYAVDVVDLRLVDAEFRRHVRAVGVPWERRAM